MSKINIIVATENTVAKRTPVCTRVQTSEGDYRFINSLAEVRELTKTGNYSIFVNYIRGRDNNAPFQKGQIMPSYREAIEYIASHEGPKYRIDLVLRNVEYNSNELAAIAANLDF